MLAGNCPHCDKFVVEVFNKDFKGNWSMFMAKKGKAVKLFDRFSSSIISKDAAIKYGNRSNMAFRYGQNIEARDRKGKKIIKRYAVDFNGTKELLKN